MGHGFRFLCQAQVRRLLFLMAAIIGLIIAVQYFEFPSTGILSLFSVRSVGNFFSTESPSSSYEVVSDGLNSTTVSVLHDAMESSESSIVNKENAEGNESEEMKESTKSNNYASEFIEGSIHSFGIISSGTGSDDHMEHYKSSILDKGKSALGGSEAGRAVAPVIYYTNVTQDIPKAMAPNMLLANDTKEISTALAPDISFTNVTEVLASILEKNRSSDTSGTIGKEKSSGLVPSVGSSASGPPAKMTKSRKSPSGVISISQMNDLLQKSHASSFSVRPKRTLEVDQQMLFAKSQIQNAPLIENDTILYAPIYRNVSMFKRSYELMENMLKVYIYQDGEKPIFHQPILEGIYASEGWFMNHMEASKKFVTKDPSEAHLFYIPFSSRLLELTLYVRHSHSRDNLIRFMKDYVDMIAAKYSFWNRTGGADHFVAACHDWAPAETRGRMLNCIRALCNADIEVGFRIGKDVSLPETYVRSAQNPLKSLEGNPPSEKPILAFFAGNIHGYVRPILLEYWQNKDPDMKIFGPMPHVKGNTNYIQHMKSSKYCICPRGHEVSSPRIVEAILYECVPIIISDNYVPPFFEVLDWESFAVFVLESDIPNLKSIILSIPPKRYLEMHKRVKKVQQYFLWYLKPVKYDLFHMILHSVWYDRVFQMQPA